MVHFSIDPRARLALVHMSGELTGRQILEANDRLYGHPLWDDAFDQIWYCRGIYTIAVGPEEMHAIVAGRAAHGGGREYVVVTRDEDYAISKLYEQLMQRAGKDVHVYRTIEEALEARGTSRLPEALEHWLEQARSA